ncbi:MAG: hypothetical protein IPJ31_04020 [Bacteroidetes bacterium]|nr:hypothetical protein [Bacteroidota bacterium]MBP6314122.1 hypothetical protein [Chitinophagaceae bacterium]
MKQILTTFLALVASLSVFGQSPSDLQYQKEPLWIQMMDAEHVQYYEAVKAFNLYWQNREKPTTENELFSASTEEKASSDFIQKKKRKKEAAAMTYAFEYKKFLRWQAKVKDYLNADGTVMNADERITSWKKQLENRK